MMRISCALNRWHKLALPRVVGFASNSNKADVNPATIPDRPIATAPKATTEVHDAQKNNIKPKLVAEAFANLKKSSNEKSKKGFSPTQLEKKIKDATTVEEILTIASMPNLSRRSALTILSTLGIYTYILF